MLYPKSFPVRASNERFLYADNLSPFSDVKNINYEWQYSTDNKRWYGFEGECQSYLAIRQYLTVGTTYSDKQ